MSLLHMPIAASPIPHAATAIRRDRIRTAQRNIANGDYDRITDAQLAALLSWCIDLGPPADASPKA